MDEDGGFLLVVAGEDTVASRDPADDGVDTGAVTTNVGNDDNKLS